MKKSQVSILKGVLYQLFKFLLEEPLNLKDCEFRQKFLSQFMEFENKFLEERKALLEMHANKDNLGNAIITQDDVYSIGDAERAKYQKEWHEYLIKPHTFECSKEDIARLLEIMKKTSALFSEKTALTYSQYLLVIKALENAKPVHTA